jgi:lysylphosphatidylglycerol synthetase-like protein (DUF2156 family)
MKKILYLVLCVAGTILPYSQFIPFLREHGLDLALFFQQLFANRVSGFFGMDVIVSSLTLLVFVYTEGARLKMRHLWIYIVCNLLVGVSLGLPLFLLMRQAKLDQQELLRTKTT